MRSLVIVGAGGFARETAQAVRAVNDDRPTWDLVSFVDDDPALSGVTIEGVPVVGPIDVVPSMRYSEVVVCTGSPRNFSSRAKLVARLDLDIERFATIVHPTAVVPPTTAVGPGTVLLAGTVATTAVCLGAHVAVMPHVTLTHDDIVCDFATIGAGARLGGGATIGAGAYIGSGAMLREGVAIGERSLIGMGAVVLDDVPADEVWVGAPARRLRTCDAASAPAEVPA